MKLQKLDVDSVVASLRLEKEALEGEVTELRQRLERGKKASRDLWKLNCAQLTAFCRKRMKR